MAYVLRKYTLADAVEVVAMLNRNRRNPRAVVDDVGNLRLIRYVPVASSKAVVVNVHDKILGFAYVADKENSFVFETGGGIHHDYVNGDIGSMLLNWAQQEAQHLTEFAPAGIKCVLQVNIFQSEQETIRIYEAEGFLKVREWAHYEIHLKEAPVAPAISNELTIRPFDLDSDADWELVGPVLDAAFADHWGAYSLPPVETLENNKEDEVGLPQDESYSNSQGYCFVAFIEDEVAGGILCNAKLVELANTGRVGSVFVNPKYRRRRVGTNLMFVAFNAFWKNGFRRVILDTDAHSFSDSAKFYSGLGMNIYRSEFLYEKEIRSGTEIRRLLK